MGLGSLLSKITEQRKALLRKEAPVMPMHAKEPTEDQIVIDNNLIFSLFTLNGVITVSDSPIFVITQTMIDAFCTECPAQRPMIKSFIASKHVVMYIDSAEIGVMQYLETTMTRPMQWSWIAKKSLQSSELSQYIVRTYLAYTQVTFQDFIEVCLPARQELLFLYFMQHEDDVFAGVKTSRGVFVTVGSVESIRGFLTLLPGRKILFCDASIELLQDAVSFIDIQTMHGARYQQINTFAEICGSWGVPFWRGRQHIPDGAYAQIVATHTRAVEHLWFRLEQEYRQHNLGALLEEITDAVIASAPCQDYTGTGDSSWHD